MHKVEKVCGAFSKPVLPNSYSDAISYYEEICKLRDKMVKIEIEFKSVIVRLEKLEEDMKNVPGLLDELVKKIKELEEKHDKDIKELKEYTEFNISQQYSFLQQEYEGRTEEDIKLWEAIRQLQVMVDLYSNASIVKLNNVEATIVDMQEFDISEV